MQTLTVGEVVFLAEGAVDDELFIVVNRSEN